VESDGNPLGAAYALDSGDTTLFIEGSTDDTAIEELTFAFLALDWTDFKPPQIASDAECLPSYGVLKYLFLPGEINLGPEPKRLRADSRILPLLAGDRTGEATDIAVSRLEIAGYRPLKLDYRAGVDAMRLAAALLIPVLQGTLPRGVFRKIEEGRKERE
jgi:CRISPR-associated protein Csx17